MKNLKLAVFVVTLMIGILETMIVTASPVVDRRSRSIWPFGGGSSSSEALETSSEKPIVAQYDPAIVPALLQIKPDDRRIWKIHKYQGFDLRPIDFVPGEHSENFVNQGSNFDSSFLGQGVSNHQESPGYPIYPPLSQENAIKVANELNQQNLQSGYQYHHQQVSASEQSVQKGFSNHHQVSASHENVEQGYSNHHEISGNHQNAQQDYLNHHEISVNQQNVQQANSNHQEVFINGGYASGGQDIATNPLYSASAIGNNEGTTEAVDLSFLDDLGGLAYFLPEPQEDQTPTDHGNQFNVGTSSSAAVEEIKDEPGFFHSLLNRLTFGVLGSTTSKVKGTVATLGQHQAIQLAPSAGFVESGDSHSVHLAAPTYHLPETQGSYIAYRLPVDNPVEISNAAVSAGPIATQQNVYSQDTQSTFHTFNNAGNGVSANLGSAQVTAGLSFADSTANNAGYTLINPRGYQNGTPVHAFVEGAADQLTQNLPALQYGPPFADSAAHNSPALQYGAPTASSITQNSPDLQYGTPTANSATQNSPALQYGTPTANPATQNSPALQYGTPTANSATQNSLALQYGTPTANSATQNSLALQYGTPTANSATQNSPALQYGTPTANSATQNSPALQYGTPTANSATQNSPALQYGTPTANSATQSSPALQYGTPTANSPSQNSLSSQYGTPTAESAPQNSPPEGVDADEQLNLSELSLINLSPPLPYRNHIDFGRYSSNSERRVSEQETEEIEETDNFTEVTRTTTPAVVVVTPLPEIARTYTRIRSYGTGDSRR